MQASAPHTKITDFDVPLGLHHRQRELAALERNASEIRHFLPSLITGLLQTPEYMRAAIATPVEPAGGDVGRAVAAKLDRLPTVDIGVLLLDRLVADGAPTTLS